MQIKSFVFIETFVFEFYVKPVAYCHFNEEKNEFCAKAILFKNLKSMQHFFLRDSDIIDS
jgi:hypothetical protein